ncbi:MAG: PLDc N-terminal domain-containing protein [Desulfobacteraceae bacterium]
MSSTHWMIIILGLLFWLMTCWAVIDIARKDFGAIEKKAAWGFTALVPFIGVLIYLIFGFKKGVRKPKLNPE